MSEFDRAALLEHLLDHYQHPRNHGEIADADARMEGGSPGCSDAVTIYLKIDSDIIRDISFEGEGCTISQAAASILTERVRGMSLPDVDALDYRFLIDELGEEIVSTRPRCASLGLETLKVAVQEYRRKRTKGEN